MLPFWIRFCITERFFSTVGIVQLCLQKLREFPNWKISTTTRLITLSFFASRGVSPLKHSILLFHILFISLGVSTHLFTQVLLKMSFAIKCSSIWLAWWYSHATRTVGNDFSGTSMMSLSSEAGAIDVAWPSLEPSGLTSSYRTPSSLALARQTFRSGHSKGRAAVPAKGSPADKDVRSIAADGVSKCFPGGRSKP